MGTTSRSISLENEKESIIQGWSGRHFSNGGTSVTNTVDNALGSDTNIAHEQNN